MWTEVLIFLGYVPGTGMVTSLVKYLVIVIVKWLSKIVVPSFTPSSNVGEFKYFIPHSIT